jgi:hypothetical protein
LENNILSKSIVQARETCGFGSSSEDSSDGISIFPSLRSSKMPRNLMRCTSNSSFAFKYSADFIRRRMGYTVIVRAQGSRSLELVFTDWIVRRVQDIHKGLNYFPVRVRVLLRRAWDISKVKSNR